MNPALRLTLVLVAIAALAFGATLWLTAHRDRAPDELAWLQSEFDLTPAQVATIETLHEDYRPVCAQHCHAIAQTRAALQSATTPAARAAAQAELSLLKELCHDATLAHLQRVAAVMPPAEASRFLALVTPRLSAHDHGAPLGLQ